jgi:CPA2 family monovalent cation:H+ antiporter-2
VIAGLGAGVNPELGPFVAAYVLILAVAGPIVARVLGGTGLPEKQKQAASESSGTIQ